MSNGVPIRPRFSFLANSSKPEDRSGVATWEFPVPDRGQWDVQTVSVTLQSFEHAHALNKLVDCAWTAGDATGYSRCEAKVLAGLRS